MKAHESKRGPGAALGAARGYAASNLKMRVNNYFWARHCKEMRGLKHMESSLLKSAFGIIGAHMKTKSDIERLAKAAGATLEEDHGYRDMRTLQIVAPEGKQWSDGGATSIRVEWAKGSTPSALKCNEDAYRDAASRVACGLEPSEDQ